MATQRRSGDELSAVGRVGLRQKDLRWLACPICRSPLQFSGQELSEVHGAVAQRIHCTGCGRAYPITDGLPVLLKERAVPAS